MLTHVSKNMFFINKMFTYVMFRCSLIRGSKYVKRYSIRSFRTNSFLSNKENEDISKLILTSNINSIIECKTLREGIISKKGTTKSVDAMIINFYIKKRCYEKAQRYINFMKQENITLNLATLGLYFKLHYFLHLEGLSTKEDEENIFQAYQNLTKDYLILDSTTNEHIILGLSVTSNWKQCFKLFNDIKISCLPNSAAYNAIISAAFSSNDYDTGWQLFEEMIENNRLPLTSTYLSYLNSIRSHNSEKVVMKLSNLFQFLATNDLKFDETVADQVLEITSEKSKRTTILNNGTCKTCSKKLQSLELSTSEFALLQRAFLDNVIVGKDIFRRTTPEELERFNNFIENMNKFDVIVDGLNVAYAAGVKQSPYTYSTLLAAVVRHFIKQRKNVLVMGRNHMEKLPKSNWHFIKDHSTVFLTENISQDDPYILYCALQCGLNTIIVTRDLMKSHLYLLKDRQNKLLFSRWLTQSRYHLIHASPDKVIFKIPLPYMMSSQKNGSYWHVPYIPSVNNSSKTSMYKWLCVST